MTASGVLISPCIDYERSYRSFIDEVDAAGEKRIPFCLSFPADDFSALMKRLEDEAASVGIASGFVANSTYWLISRGELVAVSNLRHQLTPNLIVEGGHIGYGVRPSARRRGFGHLILHETLKRARALGIEQALVTCGENNLGSIGVIKGNGGIFDSAEFIPSRGETIHRYWLPT